MTPARVYSGLSARFPQLFGRCGSQVLETPGRGLAKAAAIFASYCLLAQAAIHLTIMPEGIVTFWPPNAVVVAALLLSPVRQWWLLIAAGVAAEFVADLGSFALWQIAGFGAVNAVEAILTAIVIRWAWLGDARFTIFTVRAAVVSGVVFLFVSTPLAALGGAAIYVGGDSSIPYWEFWRLWWFGDATGLLVMTPFLLVWLGEAIPDAFRERRRRAELAVLAVSLCAGAVLVFFAPPAWPLWASAPSLLLPILAWAAIRFGLHGATAAMVVIAFVAAAGTTDGLGPFVTESSQAATVLKVQEYLLAAVVLAISLGTTFRQLTWTMRELQDERESLEERIAGRTTELRKATRAAEQRAFKDELTGTNNRRAFFEQGNAIHEHAVRHNRPYSVIMLDIDHFKHINDTFGHAAGDAALQAVADTVDAIARASDVAGRFGGDEFALCLPDTGVDEGGILAERIRRAIAGKETPWGGDPLTVTRSIGIAKYQEGDVSVDTTLIRADDALYRAKHEGRNRVAVRD